MKNPNAIVWLQDEVHFKVKSTIKSAWYKKGSRPTINSNPGQQKVSYSGFVNPKSGRLIMVKTETFNYATTIAAIREFMKQTHCNPGQKIYMIMDNASWHKKAKRLIREDSEYADLRNKIEFVDIPPYSPDCNPIEQVWRITRREVTHNKYWPDLLTLTTKLDEYFKGFYKRNKKLRSLCSFNFSTEEKKSAPKRDRKHFRRFVSEYLCKKVVIYSV